MTPHHMLKTLVALSVFLVLPCAASDPSIFLRINPTMHSAMINRVDVAVNADSSESFMVTASDDKTARVWQLSDGQLYRILRPPINIGNEGKLFAVSISADGFLVATGGWTKGEHRGFGNHKIYLFDTLNSTIIKRISGLENVVLHLDFSPDVKFHGDKISGYLAGALSGQNGIRVWNLANVTEVLRDMDYAGASYWVEFNSDGSALASSSYDGYIRLYRWQNKSRHGMTLAQRRQLKDRNQPFAVRFSPDDSKLAVAFNGDSRLAVLDAQDLSFLYWTPSAKMGAGDVYLNAWSLDGTTLYGGGAFRAGEPLALLAWPDTGQRVPLTWPVANNTLMDLQPLADGKILYASSEPSWGIINKKGEKTLEIKQASVYFNKLFPQGLLVSEDAQIIQFSHETLETQKVLRFSLSDRLLFEPPQEDPETTSEEKSKISEADDAKGEGAGEKSKANEVDKTGVTAVSSDASSEPITLSVGQAQELLIAKGFFAGVVDNILGKQTRKALSDFQKSLELPVSGKLDKATMSALLAEPSTNEPDEDAATAAKKPVLSPPILTVPDLELKSWKNSPHPQLNGNPLSLGKNDTSISYAFVPGGESFVLGTRFNFYHYDKNGKELWRKDAPGIVWALNVANNGKVLVAAFSDGTLRWYQLSNGQELLAFFPHSDARRWLAWTPNGIYAASVGADTLLGWHINNAPNEAANFYPLRSLRHHYYQPETLVKILERVNNEDTDSNVTKLLAAGDKQDASEPTLPTQFPPRIVFEDLPQNSVFSNPEVEIGYRLHFYNDMIPTTLHVMLNGRPLLTTQTEKASGSLNLQLPPRDVALAVIAENEHGVSAPEWLLLDWQGDTTEAEKPDLYILSIGISEYADENLGNLPLAGMDAQIFADKWQSQSNYYQDIQAKHLINSTYEEVREGLSWLRQAKAKDVVVVFWAGHSLQHLDNRQNTYFFLPADASLTSNTISSTILIDAFNNFPARVLMFIDTAYFSMLAKKDEKIAPADIDGFANELSSPEHGFIVFASTAGAQSSYIPEDAEHSVFTQVLLEALDGSADSNEDQQLTLQELETYVYARAHEITGGTQSPVLAMPETIRDFVLGLTP